DDFAAVFHLTRLAALRPADAEPRRRRGALHAEAGRWREAAADLARAAELDPGGADLVALAHTQLGAGDDEGYRRAVRRGAGRADAAEAALGGGLAFGPPAGPALLARVATRPPPLMALPGMFVAMLSVARPGVLESPERLLAVVGRVGDFWRAPALVRLGR